MKNEDTLQAILAILAIDGKLEQQELQFFDKMCRELELPQEKRRDLLDDVTQGKGQILIPENKDEQKELLLHLLRAAFADNKIAPEEKRLILSAAHKMGIEQKVLDEHFPAK